MGSGFFTPSEIAMFPLQAHQIAAMVDEKTRYAGDQVR
jgi:hypothetical protein